MNLIETFTLAGEVRRVHGFGSTSSAYDACQCDESVKDDTLVVIDERVVGVAHTWPFAVTTECGALHSKRPARPSAKTLAVALPQLNGQDGLLGPRDLKEQSMIIIIRDVLNRTDEIANILGINDEDEDYAERLWEIARAVYHAASEERQLSFTLTQLEEEFYQPRGCPT